MLPLLPPKGCAPYGRISQCQQVFSPAGHRQPHRSAIATDGARRIMTPPPRPCLQRKLAANPFGDGLSSASKALPPARPKAWRMTANPTPPTPETSTLSPLFQGASQPQPDWLNLGRRWRRRGSVVVESAPQHLRRLGRTDGQAPAAPQPRRLRAAIPPYGARMLRCGRRGPAVRGQWRNRPPYPPPRQGDGDRQSP